MKITFFLRLFFLFSIIGTIHLTSAASQAEYDSEITIHNEAQDLLQKGYTEKALTIYHKGLLHFPESDWLHVQYGKVLQSSEQFDEAEKEYQQALRIKDTITTRKLIQDVRTQKNLLNQKDFFSIELLFSSYQRTIAGIFSTLVIALLIIKKKRFNRIRFGRKYQNSLNKKDWQGVCIILEDDIANNRIATLEKYIGLLLKEVSYQEAITIINSHIAHPDHSATLLGYIKNYSEKLNRK